MKTLGEVLGTSNNGVYDDDIDDLSPGDFRDYVLDGHHFRVIATRQLGKDTGRRRYRVECVSCQEIVHEATTGAHCNMGYHVRDVARRAQGET